MMKNYVSKSFSLLVRWIGIGLLLGGLLLTTESYGQFTGVRRTVLSGKPPVIPLDTFQLDLSKDIAGQLMSFNDMYNLAVSLSPLIKFQNEQGVVLDATYQLSKLEILNRANASANYSTGNQVLISNDATLPNGGTLGQISNGYRVGVGVQFSLFDIFGRPQQIRQARANYQAGLMQKEITKLELKRELITVYQDLITAQQVMKIQLQEEQSALTTYQVAELESKQGTLKAEQLAEIYSRYAQAKAVAEQSKGNFLKNAYFLETLVGVPLNQMKLK
jgi:outer membrane protein TolC